MGGLISSENSLNQHIKNKHKELWESIKARCEGEGMRVGSDGGSLPANHDSEDDDEDEHK